MILIGSSDVSDAVVTFTRKYWQNATGNTCEVSILTKISHENVQNSLQNHLKTWSSVKNHSSHPKTSTPTYQAFLCWKQPHTTRGWISPNSLLIAIHGYIICGKCFHAIVWSRASTPKHASHSWHHVLPGRRYTRSCIVTPTRDVFSTERQSNHKDWEYEDQHGRENDEHCERLNVVFVKQGFFLRNLESAQRHVR